MSDSFAERTVEKLNNKTTGDTMNMELPRVAVRFTPSNRAMWAQARARVRVHVPKSKSSNGKTGPLWVTTTGQLSCPRQCGLKSNGCYATGALRHHWPKVDGNVEAGRGVTWTEFCRWIVFTPLDADIRHNQAGDMPVDAFGRLDPTAVRMLCEALGSYGGRGEGTPDRRVIIYTHAPMAGDGSVERHNHAVVRMAASFGLVINASVDHPDLLDLLPADILGAAVGPHDENGRNTVSLDAVPAKGSTNAGRAWVRCPATYRRGVTCQSCMLCAMSRSAHVVFPAHGNAFRRAAAASRRGAL